MLLLLLLLMRNKFAYDLMLVIFSVSSLIKGFLYDDGSQYSYLNGSCLVGEMFERKTRSKSL